ncbi:hypothetical protein D3C86_2192550 [compost metagenome]
MLQIGVRSHIGRVFTAKLQTHAEEVSRGGVFHGLARIHRPGEIHLLHTSGANDRGCLGMIEQQVVEQPIG